jgi:hypothetical protein
MIFADGIPKDSGASDWQDSSRLAGMMVIASHPKSPDCSRYIVNGNPVRCPIDEKANNPRQFSRDQMICLAAGLSLQGRKDLCLNMLKKAEKNKFRAPNDMNDDGTIKFLGGDPMSPSAVNHLRMCAGLSGSWWGLRFLKLDIWYNCNYTPTREPNQLITMCVIAGPEYVREYKNSNPLWKESLIEYWSKWRNEPELALMLNEKLNGV